MEMVEMGIPPAPPPGRDTMIWTRGLSKMYGRFRALDEPTVGLDPEVRRDLEELRRHRY
jgi:hypothetical protein